MGKLLVSHEFHELGADVVLRTCFMRSRSHALIRSCLLMLNASAAGTPRRNVSSTSGTGSDGVGKNPLDPSFILTFLGAFDVGVSGY
jgi:hypothetical protein